MLEINVKIPDNYKNTDDFAADLRKMIITRLKIAMKSGKTNDYIIIEQFNKFFE